MLKQELKTKIFTSTTTDTSQLPTSLSTHGGEVPHKYHGQP